MKIPFTIAVLLFASAEDLKNFQIPDVCSVLIIALSGKFRIRAGLIMAALWLVMIIFVSLFNLPVPIGMGDAKLFTALAVSFGLVFSFYTFAFASILSGVFAVFLILRAKYSAKETPEFIPFAPFITAGFVLTVLCRAFL